MAVFAILTGRLALLPAGANARLALCGLLTAAAAAFPLPAASAGLAEIVRLARDNDPQFAAARAAAEALRERLPQARALMLPSVALNANANRNETDATLLGTSTPFLQPGRRDFNSSALSLQVTQPIYRRANRIQLDQAGAQIRQSELQLQTAAQDMILRAAQAYFDVLGAEDTLALIEAQKSAIGEQLAISKRSFEVGSATIVDFNEARARYDLVTAQGVVAVNELEYRRRALGELIGTAPPTLRPLRDGARPIPPQPTEVAHWVERARRDGLSVRLQEAALEIATQEIDRQRAGHQPTLDAVGSAGQARSGASPTSAVGSDVTQFALGVQLNIPLYQGGAVQSRVREALATQARVREELEAARRSAALAARAAFLGLTGGLEQVRALEAAMESNRVSLASTEVGLKVGVRTQVDVLNAQQALFTTRRDLALARNAALLAGLRLQAAVGELDELDLAPVQTLLR